MKRITYFFIMLCLGLSASFGQEEIKTETFDASKVKSIDLRFKYPELVTINTWDKKEVQVKADILINDGDDNEKFELRSRVSNGVLEIDSRIDDINGYSGYNIDRGKRKGITITGNGSTITRSRVGGRNSVTVSVLLEVFVPKGMEVDVDARYGIVEVLSTELSLTVDSRYGGIDVVVDESQDLDIEASTQWGQIYHNLDSKLRADGEGFPGKWMRTSASLNRGTRKLHVESQYGNVYLRKNN